MSGEGHTEYSKMNNLAFSQEIDEIPTSSWVAPVDLDAFLIKIYDYYRGKGLSCSLLSKFLNLL